MEVAALAAFAFSRPVLDSFGDTPELFLSRRARTADIVLFGLAVTFIPAAVVAAVGTASRPFGRRVRHATHLGLLVVLGGVAAWRLGHDQTDGSNAWLIGAAVLVGALLGGLRAWSRSRRPTASFLRVAGAGSLVVFLGQFLLVSPTSTLAFGRDSAPSADVDRLAAAGDRPGDLPPVVFVVFDALPTVSLLDGTGQIDDALYPNFASLAGEATWYRNNTTVAGRSLQAVPAILTGRYPGPDPSASDPDPENLFTLLGGAYDITAREPMTALCPQRLCPPEPSAGVGTLLGDAVEWWQKGLTPELFVNVAVPNALPGALDARRYDLAQEFIDGLDVSQGDRPQLAFLHVVLPHGAWVFTEDGEAYDGSTVPTGWLGDGWSNVGTAVGRQRHLLQTQAADRLLGQLLDDLRAAGSYDDALIVVTADHGDAFVPGEPGRSLSEGNLTHIAWTPLLVKAPGQTQGQIDDGNVETIDILPTVADHLGVEIPWQVDGAPAGLAADARDPDVKLFADHEDNVLRPPDGETFLEIDATSGLEAVISHDPTPGDGPDAIWRVTEHGDLFGVEVAELTLGEPADAAVTIDDASRYDEIDTSEPLPLEVVARTDVAEGRVVAFVLNGTIGALGEVQDPVSPGGNLVHGLLPPRLFVDGANELAAYLVEGPPGDAVLRPLRIER